MIKRSPLSLALALSFACGAALAAQPAQAQLFVSASFSSGGCGWSPCPVTIGAAFAEPAYYAAAPTYYTDPYADAYYAAPVYGASLGYVSPGVDVSLGFGAVGLGFASAPYAYGPYQPYGFGGYSGGYYGGGFNAGFAYSPYAYPGSVNTVNTFSRTRTVNTIVRNRGVVTRNHGVVARNRTVVAHNHTVVAHNHTTVVAHNHAAAARPVRQPFSLARNERAAPTHAAPMRAAPMRGAPEARPGGGGRPGGHPPHG
jgi:hypothetical protein